MGIRLSGKCIDYINHFSSISRYTSFRLILAFQFIFLIVIFDPDVNCWKIIGCFVRNLVHYSINNHFLWYIVHIYVFSYCSKYWQIVFETVFENEIFFVFDFPKLSSLFIYVIVLIPLLMFVLRECDENTHSSSVHTTQIHLWTSWKCIYISISIWRANATKSFFFFILRTTQLKNWFYQCVSEYVASISPKPIYI